MNDPRWIRDPIPRPTHSLERLDWDSKHFGFGVAHLSVEDASSRDVAEALLTARNIGIRLVYVRARRALEGGEIEAAWLGAVDERLTFAFDLRTGDPQEAPTGHEVESWSDSVPSDDLERLAIQSGEFSRFAVDPRIPAERFESLYREWLNRSVRREIAQEVLVVREAGKVGALMTLVERDRAGQIGLLAVHPSLRRRGLGGALIVAGKVCLRARGGDTLRVVTQARNEGSCALYRRHGFVLERREYLHHVWLE